MDDTDKHLSTYCPSCDTPIEARLVEREETLWVKGRPTSYVGTAAICPLCGEAIGDSHVGDGNLRAAYAAYAASCGSQPPVDCTGTQS